MGIATLITNRFGDITANVSTPVLVAAGFAIFVVLSIVVNVFNQLLRKNPHEPPMVFHWVPFIGSTISYGIDPYKFFDRCHDKYGDTFTFILLGKKTTVCLGTKGNDIILNGKHKDVSAEEIYSPLTTPVFGKDVVYDCPNAKLMEQKKFMKFGLTLDAFRSYVPLIADEVNEFIKKSPSFKGASGTFDVSPTMAEITIYTASRSLQGKEVRERFDSTFADLYHDLDMGFTPINFMFPWAPLPQNRRRDNAQRTMAQIYMDIISARREKGTKQDSQDMIWNLMGSTYKNGVQVPDKEIANMMIALLMAGQHSSSSTSSWILLRLASRPDVMDELLEEQISVFGPELGPLTYDNLQRLPLHQHVIKETLRLHSPIHSIMRKVKNPLPIDGTSYVVPTSHVLLAAPGVTSRREEYFPNPTLWDPHRWDPSNRSEGVTSANSVADDDEKTDYGYGLVSKGAGSPYLPFGAGRHRCIGEQFAYVQLGTVLATFVREFRLKNVGTKVEEVVGTDYSSLFSRPLTPSIVAWERRSTQSSTQ
ncbi:MAG: Sterol 14-alpha demethylase [Chaenotheca gracillima]|nr:MAG: Sterol 14-alpha demethylase [Chaenotheca gracillima]